jgi:predicted kinase
MRPSDTALPGTLHFFCGKIGAGKTTLANQLATQPNHVLVTEDTWLSRLYAGEMKNFDDYLRNTLRLREVMAPHIASLLSLGISVVLDFQSNTLATRKWARGVFEAANLPHGAPHQLHWMDIPDDECRRRMHRRNATGTHPYQLTDEDFDKITPYFVAPSAEEGFTVVRHAM